jgi:hypothetical protein
MPTVRLIPSHYVLAHPSYMSFPDNSHPVENLYTNTSSETYATVRNKRTTRYYLYVSGFNFEDVPTGVSINSFTIKTKISRSNSNTNTTQDANTILLVTGTTTSTTIAGSARTVSTDVQTLTFTGITASWETIKSYGSNFGLAFPTQSTKQNNGADYYIYGIEIEVNYSLPSQDKIYTKTSTGWTELQKVFKKTNGSWVEQTDLTNVFESDKIYVRN